VFIDLFAIVEILSRASTTQAPRLGVT
jgi:hypothetical protein